MNNYNVYRIDREQGITQDKAVLEWNRGCNGTDHVDLLNKVWYIRGQVDYAEELASVHRGHCDGICTAENMGEFIYPVPRHAA